jgi:HSP20 family protein
MALNKLIPWKKEDKSPEIEAVDRDWDDPFLSLREEMNQMFDDFFTRPFGMRPYDALEKQIKGFSPRMDVVEDDQQITITAELPGMDENEINLGLKDNNLIITGTKKSEKTEKGKTYYRSERSYGSFKRMVALPDSIDADRISAEFKKGVLKIHVPKLPEIERKAKRIEIKRS